MEIVFDLLKKIIDKNVSLSLQDNELHFSDPKALLSKSERTNIAKFEKDIIKMCCNIPLSKSQRMEFERLKDGANKTQNNSPFCLKLGASFHLAKLNLAWKILLQDFPRLRSTIVEKQGDTIYSPNDKKLFKIKERRVKLTKGMDESTYIQSQIDKPFTVQDNFLLRAEVSVFSATKKYLLITISSVLADAKLAKSIVSRLLAIYNMLGRSEKKHYIHSNILDQHRQAIEDIHYYKSSRATSDRAYWSSQLEDAVPILKLYGTSCAKQEVNVPIKSEIELKSKRAIQVYANSHEIESSAIFLALFKHLLYKLSGQKDITIGLVKGNKYCPTSLNGVFSDMVLVRTTCEEKILLSEFSIAVQQAVLSSLNHSNYPPSRMVEEKVITKDHLDSLFGITFEYQTYQSKAPSSKDFRANKLNLELEAFNENRLSLNLIVVEKKDSVLLKINCQSGALSQASLDLLLSRFKYLLESISVSANPLMQDCLVTTKSEQQMLVTDFNNTYVKFKNAVNLHDLFIAQVMDNGNKIAVLFNQQALTYSELFNKSKALAAYLQSSGSRPGDLIGLCTERTPDMLVGMLAILMAGSAYVPLDPEYPEERLAYILADSQAKIVITQTKLITKLKTLIPQDTQIIEVDLQKRKIRKSTDSFDLDKSINGLSSNSLAYIIYTSGSTGKPKGVAIEHHSAVALVNWASQIYTSEEMKCVLASTSICFDLSVFEIFVTLSKGGTILLARNALELANIGAKDQVTLINTVPSAIAELVRAKAIPRSVKTINLAGEPLLPNLVNEIYQTTTADKVYDLYGPSEDTTYSTFIQRKLNGPQTIGRPIANTRVYVLDDAQNLQPIGVPGELHLSGDGLARGYLNQPELTREKFIANPFEEKQRMYKTGDLARWNKDGTIDYMGRIDNQVKVRGYRIEVGEIEAQLNSHPRVKESVVITQGELDNKSLVAFYVLHKASDNQEEGSAKHEIEIEEIVSFLGAELPNYMIPQMYRSLSVIPLTQNGKINRRELESYNIQASNHKEYIAPTTELEQILVKCFSQALGIPANDVSITNNFLELGGHSLLAYRLISTLQNKMSVNISLKVLLEANSIRELCQDIELGDLSRSPLIEKADASDFKTGYPLSYSQEQLWTLEKLQVGGTAYNVPKAVLLNFEVDINQIQASINQIVERHQSLRTIFPEFHGQPKQVILEHLNVNLEVSDLSHYKDPIVQQETADKICQNSASTKFDLEHGPLIKVSAIKLASQKNIIMLTMHHIICDDWSFNIILNAIYAGIKNLPEEEIPTESNSNIEYTDYCVWQRTSMAKSSQTVKKLDYWEQKLAGTKQSIGLLTDFPRQTVQSYNGGEERFLIDEELTGGLKILADSNNVSMFMTLITVFKVILFRYTGNEDICVGSVVANRQQQEIEELVGMFVNTLALRTDILANDTFEDVLQKVKATCLDAIDNQEVPFDKVVELSRVERNSSMNPLFQVMLILQNIPMESYSKEFTEYSVRRVASKFDFTIELFESEKGLQGIIEYDTQLYKPQTIQTICLHFIAICEAVCKQPKTQLHAIDYLSDSENKQLLEDFNQTEQEYFGEQCVHSLFEKTASQFPDKVAVVYKSQDFTSLQLSYQELHQKSRQLALYLQQKGVTNDTLVGLYANRSIEMLIGMIAILQAGGAYLPLDPDFPQERIQYMLEDSNTSIVLTQHGLHQTIKSFVPESVELFCLDSDWDTMLNSLPDTSSQNALLQQASSPRDLAYVIYTSGSTGNPKGVMIEHRSFVNFILSMSNDPGITQQDKLLAITTISFDIAGLELFLPLISGAEVCLCAKETLQQSESLSNIISHYRPTLMQATPATWQMLFHAGWQNEESVKALCGGEALTSALKSDFCKTKTLAWNMFGPTETTVWSSISKISKDKQISIGKPIANTKMYILDSFNNLVPIGVVGELYIAGDGLARGYLNREELTRERFIQNPYQVSGRLYKTGDLARWMSDGSIEYLARSDTQVKIRGFRIEIGEIENQLQSYPDISECAVVVQGEASNKRLVAFYTTKNIKKLTLASSTLNEFLARMLPKYMLPAAFVGLEAIPLTPNGKTNRIVLQNTTIKCEAKKMISPSKNSIEDKLLELWSEVLEISPSSISIHDNFFDIGGNSLNVVVLASRIEKSLSCDFPAMTLFKVNTIKRIAQVIQENDVKKEVNEVPVPVEQKAILNTKIRQQGDVSNEQPEYYKDSLAIVGISCQLPQATNHWQFWENLCGSKESVSRLSLSEIEKFQIDSDVLSNQKYVPTTAWLEGKELFDPSFFNLSSGNAALMDPQFRQLLMHSWKAVEDAGYVCDDIPNTSVFMSASNNFYQSMSQSISLSKHVMENSEEFVSWLQGQGGTIPTMISYQLGLKGQSSYIHTNCSSSLTALYSAYQSLQSRDVDYALVGAASFSAAMHLGYIHQPGLNLSSDGHCRTFDTNADGMVEGEGVGVLLVKRAFDAIRDNDNIYCLVRGIGVNNDGNEKAGFYAPSITGQSSVIQQVLEKTKIDPNTINYVEAHGTGTALGDPIEVMALTEAYREYTDKNQFCGIGSVKPNIGHLDTAAGLVGLIKLSLSLNQKSFPPQINYQDSNPQIDFENSPFYVLTEREFWSKQETPKRAALSSFGIGGTNTHAILEEYLDSSLSINQHETKQHQYLVPLSAKRHDVLVDYASQLCDYLQSRTDPKAEISDVAYTLQVGRKEMQHRVVFLVNDVESLMQALQNFVNNKVSSQYFYKQINLDKDSHDSLALDEDFQELIQHWVVKNKVRNLAKLWVDGEQLNWQTLYINETPRRISLPTYPFAKESFWIEPVETDIASSMVSTNNIHPLLHINTSDLSQQSYSSTFNGRESFLVDHVINGQMILPAVAYLELARAAVNQATPKQAQLNCLQISNVVWARPMVFERQLDVRIDLNVSNENKILFEIRSVNFETDSKSDLSEIVHCQGSASYFNHSAPQKVELSLLTTRMLSDKVSMQALYKQFQKLGTDFGPAHRSLDSIYQGENELLAKIDLPSCVNSSQQLYFMHPSVMDGILQASTVLIAGVSRLPEKTTLPFALEKMLIFSECRSSMNAWIRFAEGSKADDKLVKLDIDLYDDSGNVCVQITGYSARLYSEANAANHEVEQGYGLLLARPVWELDLIAASQSSTQYSFAEHYITLGNLQQVDRHLVQANSPMFVCKVERIELEDSAASYQAIASSCFERVQQIIQAKPRNKVLFQILIEDTPWQRSLLGLSGLLETANLENPNFIGQVILVEKGIAASDVEQRILTGINNPLPNLLLQSNGQLQRKIWKEFKQSELTESGVFKSYGVYLITGGLGRLGVLFAQEIVARCDNAKIILTGRSELTEAKKKLLSELASHGSHIEYRQLDLNNLEELKGLLAELLNSYKQLNGILHCAGMIADNFIFKKSLSEFNKVLEPKIVGTCNIDIASNDIDLDFIVLFSSESSLGSVGQSDYATANGFMDQFSTYRNRLVSQGLRTGKTLAINWPFWKDGGMSLDESSIEMMLVTSGMVPMSKKTGMRAFYQALNSQCDQLLVIEGDIEKIRTRLFSNKQVILSELDSEQKVSSVEATQSEVGRVTDESSEIIDNKALKNQTQEYLAKQFAELFKMPAHQIDPNAELESYGIDSIMAINLINQLETTFGSLSKTLVFEYQTVAELADYFVSDYGDVLNDLFAIEPTEIIQTLSSETNGLNEPVQDLSKVDSNIDGHLFKSKRLIMGNKISGDHADTYATHVESDIFLKQRNPIAIVGLSGRYPESVDIEAFWHNLRDGKDCIIEIPKERWDWTEYYTDDKTKDGHHYSKWGGFISGVDEFDPRFFNISPKEAEILDPQERLFLQHAWKAVEDSGYTRKSLQVPHDNRLAGQVGVYVGVMYSEYQLLGAEASLKGNRLGFANSLADIANRVSYVFNFHGPSLTVDTMCSSSLTAIHLACQDLKLGQTDVAIAGGVNVNIHPNKYLILSSGQYISTSGHCHSFGVNSDGYTPGEGVGAVVLKRLTNAERDGDHIYGLIKGSTLNHGGKNNGYTVPNPNAQADAIGQALRESLIDARCISYIEAHGTGTKLGDPIEISALSKAFYKHSKQRDVGYCQIGSAKSNIGHCESAAGIAGLTKVLLQMKHKKIVPSLHSAELNPHIDFDKTPFKVNQTLSDWKQPIIDGKTIPRLAGISSFGAGGANAHMIIEEYQTAEVLTNSQSSVSSHEVVIPLSARTEKELIKKVEDLVAFITSQERNIELEALAYTLQVGRESMDRRLGVVVNSIEQLVGTLRSYLNSEKQFDRLFLGEVKKHKDYILLLSQDEDMQVAIEKWVEQKKLTKLLELWVKGLEVNWTKLYQSQKTNRISLPTYPFSNKRYWWDSSLSEKEKSVKLNGIGLNGDKAIHRLLQVNRSILGLQSYSSVFDPKDEHLFLDRGASKMLSPTVCLEMIRSAVEHALDSTSKNVENITELKNVVWGKSINFSDKREVSIALFENGPTSVDFEIYSIAAERDDVLCQGTATYESEKALPKLDLEHIRSNMTKLTTNVEIASSTSAFHRGEQYLLSFDFSENIKAEFSEFVLNPTILDTLIQSVPIYLDGNSRRLSGLEIPFKIDSMKIFSECRERIRAIVKYSSNSVESRNNSYQVDIDLCDDVGNTCIQLRGVHYQLVALESEVYESRLKESKTVRPTPESKKPEMSRPKQVNFLKNNKSLAASSSGAVESDLQIPNGLHRDKPLAITLQAASKNEMKNSRQANMTKPTISLSRSNIDLPLEIKSTPTVRLYDCGDGIYKMQLGSAAEITRLSEQAIDELNTALEFLRGSSLVKAVIFYGSNNCFLVGNDKEIGLAVKQGLYQNIVDFPYPTIACMAGNANGAGFVLSALCDFLVASEEATYSYSDNHQNDYPSVAEYNLLKERFGVRQTENFISAGSLSGGKIAELGWSIPVLRKSEVMMFSQKLASDLSTKPRAVLTLLKKHLARHIRKYAYQLTEDKLSKKLVATDHTQRVTTLPSFANLRLEIHGNNVLEITISTSRSNVSKEAVFIDLISLLRHINLDPGIKVVVLQSEYDNFIPSHKENLSYKTFSELRDLLLGLDAMVVGAIECDAHDIAWILCQFCDLCILSKQGTYSLSDVTLGERLDQNAVVIFSERLGQEFTKRLLLTGLRASGEELKKQLATIQVTDKDNVREFAMQSAKRWADSDIEKLIELKKSKALFINKQLRQLPKSLTKPKLSSVSYINDPTPVDIDSDVIQLTAYPDGILVISMQDKQAKNMFSTQFVDGMQKAYQHVEEFANYKAVILTGYENYFASGGTKDALIAIHEGNAKFTDIETYHAALSCKVPVIAAMQGHAIGAGWSMGMFADFVLFSNESKFLSPYVNYGFTPGAGSTLVLTDKLGYDIARENLLTATPISGSELQKRGLSTPVLPRKEIFSAAMSLAKQIAINSVERLTRIKQLLAAHLNERLPETYRLELEMHEITFVGRADALDSIERKFGTDHNNFTSSTTKNVSLSSSQLDIATMESSSSPSESVAELSDVIEVLKQYLADELHLALDEIDAEEQFIDLGLDSITGVTWVRKINENFKLAIEATKVYSHPTLKEFSIHVNNVISSNTKVDQADIHNIERQRVNPKKLSVSKAANIVSKLSSAPSASSSVVTGLLKKYLAQELHMEIEEFDEQAQFIDLGLDSITGVTWVRKINEEFKLSIEATKVYSYPTLAEFGEYVSGEVNQQGQNLDHLISDEAIESSQTEAQEQKESMSNHQTNGDSTTVSLILESLANLLAQELHMEIDEIDASAQFIDLGLDSITGVTWVRKINDKYQLTVEATKVYSFPTLQEFSHYVASEVGKLPNSMLGVELDEADKISKASSQTVVLPKTSVITSSSFKSLKSWRKNRKLTTRTHKTGKFEHEPIAVIGLAGQFPQAKNIDEFWENIKQGKNCISEISKQRWNVDDFYQQGIPTTGKTNSKWMGAIEEYDLFDPLFFNISPAEAEFMDPQQRLFLQASWHCIENAGYNPRTLSGSKCGVFVGCSIGDYNLFSKEQLLSAQGFTGNSISILAARISYFLNLQGPCISIETACSSSLVAIANACDSLNTGASDTVLAGGVHVMSGPSLLVKTAQSGMLSNDGKCFAFDQRANGFVAGEGVGVVMLKRLADAEKDRDIIQGVVQGWGVNQDGKTNGITAPNPVSQTRLQQDIYQQFDIDPACIQLIEAHGTGTKLGDPIEIEGLKDTFKKFTGRTNYCALGSVKSNIGHCVTAAGVAGFIKLIFSLKYKTLPPTINYQNLNEHISLENSPFFISDKLRPWEVLENEKRQAAISSFGFSGTNAHIVISEYESSATDGRVAVSITQEHGSIIPLSAKTSEQLQQKAADLLDYLRRQDKVELADLAYTLQVGREAMEERFAVLVNSVDQLVDKIEAYLKLPEGTEKHGESNLYRGKISNSSDGMGIIGQDKDVEDAIVDKLISDNKLSKLTALWIKGVDWNWQKLYPENKPLRINLPVYPFAKERYWIESEFLLSSGHGPATSVPSPDLFIHPLLQINTSDLRQQSYLSNFSGEEFFLKDHQVLLNTSSPQDSEIENVYSKLPTFEKILPGVAYLEIARAAIENATPDGSELMSLELHHTVWVQPVIVDQETQIGIAISPNDENVIDYEIYSQVENLVHQDGATKKPQNELNENERVIHCQGQAVFTKKVTPEPLDISQLKLRMNRATIEAEKLYETFLQTGLNYGPAHQCVTKIYQGERQVLAELRLPSVVDSSFSDYRLHPSLMDSALQTSIGLHTDSEQLGGKPSIPFALDTLRIISECSKEMFVWVRYSPDSQPGDNIERIDIDLCDLQGNVCVQMQGFSTRVMEVAKYKLQSGLDANNDNLDRQENDQLAQFDDAYYAKIIEQLLDKEISVDEAVELG
jgi:amino acid adenylation domain-containing protein